MSPGCNWSNTPSSQVSSPARTTWSQIRSIAARGSGSIETIRVPSPWSLIDRQAKAVVRPEPISRYSFGWCRPISVYSAAESKAA